MATWLALLITIGTGVFALGKQTQKISDQQDQISELKEKIEATQEIPIKLATLEADVKYLIQGMGEIKQFLMRKVGE